MLLQIRQFLLVLIVTVLFFKLSFSYGAQNITKVSGKQGLRNITGKKRVSWENNEILMVQEYQLERLRIAVFF